MATPPTKPSDSAAHAAPSPAAAAEPERRGVPWAVLGLLVVTLGAAGVAVWMATATTPGGSAGGTAGAPTAVPATAGYEAALEAGRSYLAQRKWAEAESVLAAAAAKFPDQQQAPLLLAEALMAQRRFGEAYGQYRAALRVGPATPDLHAAAGVLADDAGELGEAAAQFQQAEAKAPGEARHPLYLAMVQAKQGEDTKAMASLLRALRLNPDLAPAWGTLAELSFRNNDLTLAAQHAAKARELEPGAARWRHLEARVLKRQNLPREAAALLTALPPEQRRDPAVLRTLAECYGMLKRPGDAAAAYAEAAAAAPENAELVMEAAGWFRRAGDVAASRRHAERAAALGHPAARAMLAELDGPAGGS